MGSQGRGGSGGPRDFRACGRLPPTGREGGSWSATNGLRPTRLSGRRIGHREQRPYGGEVASCRPDLEPAFEQGRQDAPAHPVREVEVGGPTDDRDRLRSRRRPPRAPRGASADGSAERKAMRTRFGSVALGRDRRQDRGQVVAAADHHVDGQVEARGDRRRGSLRRARTPQARPGPAPPRRRRCRSGCRSGPRDVRAIRGCRGGRPSRSGSDRRRSRRAAARRTVPGRSRGRLPQPQVSRAALARARWSASSAVAATTVR